VRSSVAHYANLPPITNLKNKYTRCDLKRMDWAAIAYWRPRVRDLTELFRRAVCNVKGCPMGYSFCRGALFGDCKFYDLLKSVEYLRRRKGVSVLPGGPLVIYEDE